MKHKALHVLYCCFLTAGLLAQKQAIAPRDSAKAAFDGKKISITYGKPSMQGRKIFGVFVPYYKIWRTGSGAATTLTTEADIEVDGAIVPKGVYTLYTYPAAKNWKLIINKQTGQWGTVYNAQLDLARIGLSVKSLKSSVEALTFKIDKLNNADGMLKIEWEKTQLSVPFHISTESLIPSPLDSVSLSLHDARICIKYSRPSMRGRKIMGGVVQYGKVWRTGANAATELTTTADVTLSGVTIPKGSYTLYSMPSSKNWKLIINKQTGQWGTVYDQELDLAQVPLKKHTLKHPVEKFTIELEKISPVKGAIHLLWEKTELWNTFSLQ